VLSAGTHNDRECRIPVKVGGTRMAEHMGIVDQMPRSMSIDPARAGVALLSAVPAPCHLLEPARREQAEEWQSLLHHSLDGILHALTTVVALRDVFVAEHQRKVRLLTDAITDELGLDAATRHGAAVAAQIHDVGKIAVPAGILSCPRHLTANEFALIMEHPQTGLEIVKGIAFPWPVADIISQHHERMDGSGYPLALGGGAILLEARILGVADVVEAMTSHRPYRPALALDAALAEIADGRGSRYDADIADACTTVLTRHGLGVFTP
jgi:putative nucleotidyltransferase with HDIG domain